MTQTGGDEGAGGLVWSMGAPGDGEGPRGVRMVHGGRSGRVTMTLVGSPIHVNRKDVVCARCVYAGIVAHSTICRGWCAQKM